MDKDYFYFKQFKLRNRDTALKINTDGVLLAAWVNMDVSGHINADVPIATGQVLGQAKAEALGIASGRQACKDSYEGGHSRKALRVLDIGTGGGVIPFILHQRYPDLFIDGLDIHEPSIQEANYNKALNSFSKNHDGNNKIDQDNSRNMERLQFYHKSLQAFVVDRCDDTSNSRNNNLYDFIISNPPFFPVSNSVTPSIPQLGYTTAKHTHTLDHETLIKGTTALLKANGHCAFVIPYDLMEGYMVTAAAHCLHLQRRCIISGKEALEPNRVMIELRKGKSESAATAVKEESLFIRNPDNSYSKGYKALTRELYLGF